MLEHLGHTTILYVDTAGRRHRGRGRRRNAGPLGDVVGLAFKAGRVHLFDANGDAL